MGGGGHSDGDAVGLEVADKPFDPRQQRGLGKQHVQDLRGDEQAYDVMSAKLN